MNHPDEHPLAGRTVKLKIDLQNHDAAVIDGAEFRVEDWWDRLTGGSWMSANGNPAAILYALRTAGIPLDDEVVYGKIGAFGHLVHVSELGEVLK